MHGELTREVIGAFFEVYNALRPGYLESTYAGALALELTDRGVAFEREPRLDVFYKGRVAGVYRPDFFVDRRVVVELKATRAVGDADKRQLVHYLRATNTRLGLLLHFGAEANLFRIINSEYERAAKLRVDPQARSEDPRRAR
ncbi:MAG: GxxExxY protein [Gemmatimonadaceae bacterium]